MGRERKDGCVISTSSIDGIRLTQYATGGCGACIGPPGELERVLSGRPLAVGVEGMLATNHYVNDRATIPFPGTWKITANARVSDFDQLTFTVTVPVR